MRFGEQDEKLDRALRMIGQASAREGLEGRILRGVEARQSQAVGRSRVIRLRWGIGLAVALVIAGFIASSGGHQRPETRRMGTGIETHQQGVSIQEAGPVVAAVNDRRAARTDRSTHAKMRRAENDRGSERASFPSPEAPLTEQERLLQALAGAPQKQAVEALDPVRRAEEIAEVDRSVQAFFEERNNGGNE